jgi:hypothetical protein
VAWWLTGPSASNFIVSHILKDDAHYDNVACKTLFFILAGRAQILLMQTSRLPVEVLSLNLSRLSGYYTRMYHQVSISETSLIYTRLFPLHLNTNTQNVFRVFRFSQRSECSCSVIKKNVLVAISDVSHVKALSKGYMVRQV